MSDMQMPTDQYQILSSRPLVMHVSPELADTKRMDLEYYQPHYVNAISLLRSAGYDLAQLDSLCEESRPISYGVLKPIPVEDGVSLIRNQDFVGSSIDFDNCIHIPWKQHQEYGRSEVRTGDLLITLGGYVGRAAVANQKAPVSNISRHIARCSIDDRQADVHFLWAFLTSHLGMLLLQRQVTGSVQRGINLGDLRLFEVPIPVRAVQEYIGAKVRLAERCRARARELWGQVLNTLNQMYKGAPTEILPALDYRVGPAELDSPRLDSWHYQPVHRRLVKWCREHQFVPVSSIASLSRRPWSPSKTKQLLFNYIEISDVDTGTGRVVGKEVLTAEAPGRARQLVRPFDVLISTVRPERKGVGIATPDMDGWVASTGFGILKAESPALAYFLCAVLRHDVSTLQLMRWNTGATYPAIDADVPLEVLIPYPGVEMCNRLGRYFQDSIQLHCYADELAREAKSDAEALINGKLDVDGIVDGRIQLPTWEDFEV